MVLAPKLTHRFCGRPESLGLRFYERVRHSRSASLYAVHRRSIADLQTRQLVAINATLTPDRHRTEHHTAVTRQLKLPRYQVTSLVETQIFFQNWPFPKEPLRNGPQESDYRSSRRQNSVKIIATWWQSSKIWRRDVAASQQL